MTLAALEGQTWPRDLFEVVIVDDGSEPPVEPPRSSPLAVKVVREERRGFGAARARNTGVRGGTAHDILLFLDSDMLAEAGLITAHARWHHTVADALTLGFHAYVAADDLDAESIRRRTGVVGRAVCGPAAGPALDRSSHAQDRRSHVENRRSVQGGGEERLALLREEFGPDPRVRVGSARSALDEFPATPFHVTLPAGAVFAKDLVHRLRAGLGDATAAVAVLPDGSRASITPGLGAPSGAPCGRKQRPRRLRRGANVVRRGVEAHGRRAGGGGLSLPAGPLPRRGSGTSEASRRHGRC